MKTLQIYLKEEKSTRNLNNHLLKQDSKDGPKNSMHGFEAIKGNSQVFQEDMSDKHVNCRVITCKEFIPIKRKNIMSRVAESFIPLRRR